MSPMDTIASRWRQWAGEVGSPPPGTYHSAQHSAKDLSGCDLSLPEMVGARAGRRTTHEAAGACWRAVGPDVRFWLVSGRRRPSASLCVVWEGVRQAGRLGDRAAPALPLATAETTPQLEGTVWNVKRSGTWGEKWSCHFGMYTAEAGAGGGRGGGRR